MKFSLVLCFVGLCVALSSALPQDQILRYINRQKIIHPIKHHYKALETFRQWIMTHPDLKGFTWSDCGNSTSTFKIKGLTLGPDPLVFPGTLTVGFALDLTDDFVDSLSGSVEMYRKLGASYIKIPCIGNIGSCTYDDLCSLMSQIQQCPQPFIDNNIPCQCPFKKNSYKMPDSQIDVDAAVVPPGDYKAIVHLNHKGKGAGCLQVTASFA
ncbi:ganglioside GM2 activator-like [Argonauta hians]